MAEGAKVKDPVGEEEAETMMPHITDVIKYVRGEFKKKYYEFPLHRVCEINEGPCEDFAEVVNEWIPAAKVISTSLAFEFYHKPLKKILTVVDSDDELVIYRGKQIELPAHYWILYRGMHYDAETPNGVKHWIELPLFKRALKKAQGR